MKRLKLLVIIVDRSQVDKVCETASAFSAQFCHICYGKGTAKNDWLNMLGIGEIDKGIIFATITEQNIPKLHRILLSEYGFDKPGGGISFTIPLNSVGGPASLKVLEG